MVERHEPSPIPMQDASGRRARDARMSQAAAVRSIGAAARGRPERVDAPEAIGLPADLTPLRAAPEVRAAATEALATLDAIRDLDR